VHELIYIASDEPVLKNSKFEIPYYFKYKMPSNLRHIQFLSEDFRRKL
jgi:hypothetical protein